MHRESLFRFGRGSRSASPDSDQPGNGSPQVEHGPSGYDSAVRGGYARQAGQSPQSDACCGSLGREPGERTFSRVGFLGTGLVTAAAVAGLYPSAAKATTSVQVWGLDPNWDGCGCAACRSCRLHAANKLFASVSDAGNGRAHRYCKCLVVPLALVDQGVYNALFVRRGARGSVDRRWTWVQDALAQGPPVPAPAEQPFRPDPKVSPRLTTHKVRARAAQVRARKPAAPQTPLKRRKRFTLKNRIVPRSHGRN